MNLSSVISVLYRRQHSVCNSQTDTEYFRDGPEPIVTVQILPTRPHTSEVCFGDMNLTNFIMDDGEDPSSRLTVLDFEHANFPPTWLTRDAHISQGIRLGVHL